ncbi:hypothetical protein GSH05_00350 [Burkholderia pseudomallei]|uniref:Uncharacterized protein n=3 Tax=pseudomallei group TaxID=111527 RepID=A0AAX1XCG1_BURML|nr:hypothetical protein BMAA0840 [Burkholderia mallei ATCC 23344]AUG25933.1 hypothetical protein CXQ84_24610 [Burkholderia pseudomallei]PNX00778.1 hypothetical protein CF649_21905 [Burkholderia sp. 136(2017)]PNX12843.1 hypothetical protein CF650_23595 [Burkholderia sp. 129]PNX27477.1 hypothetical protein CF647_21570 [Burkholderia sp. 117]PNX36128.1 hypothetical protein CF648_22815 [Burkholderia sp. 137]RKN96475.1 hypothetical protein D8O31_17365 [Burkholderia mallei]
MADRRAAVRVTARAAAGRAMRSPFGRGADDDAPLDLQPAKSPNRENGKNRIARSDISSTNRQSSKKRGTAQDQTVSSGRYEINPSKVSRVETERSITTRGASYG